MTETPPTPAPDAGVPARRTRRSSDAAVPFEAAIETVQALGEAAWS